MRMVLSALFSLIFLMGGDFESPAQTSPPTVGVYYYPWHRHDFHGRRYLREHLVPVQLPTLGEYDDREANVIRQHADWSRYAGIRLWVCSWWGPNSREDRTLLDHTLQSPDLGDIKIAVFYETTGRTSNFTDYSRIAGDVEYLADHYFEHPNYYRIDGKPVVAIYLTRVLSAEGTLASTVAAFRQAASDKGFELFLIGDQVFGHPPAEAGDMGVLDAVTEYDVYGSMGRTGYAEQDGVDHYITRQTAWKNLADSVDVPYIPAVTPGFNDKAVRDGHAPVSRRLSPGEDFGTLFKALLDSAVERTDPRTGNLFLVTSWNEWHEDTQIEPVAAAPPTPTDDSPSGTAYTEGLDYEGYELRYLDLLRETVIPSPADHWRFH